VGKALHFPRVRGSFALRVLSSLLPVDNTCAVLEDVEQGSTVLLLVRSSEDTLALSFLPPEKLGKSIKSCSIAELAEYAFVRVEPPAKGFEWEYFAREARAIIQKTVKDAFGSSLDSYNELLTHIADRIPFAIKLSTTTGGSLETSRYIYDELIRILGYVDDHEPVTT